MSGARRQRPVGLVWRACLWKHSFMGTQPCPCTYTHISRLRARGAVEVVMMEAACPATSKVFTLWTFTESLLTSSLCPASALLLSVPRELTNLGGLGAPPQIPEASLVNIRGRILVGETLPGFYRSPTKQGWRWGFIHAAAFAESGYSRWGRRRVFLPQLSVFWTETPPVCLTHGGTLSFSYLRPRRLTTTSRMKGAC